MEKEVRIFIRIQKYRKDEWKRKCLKKNISLTRLIIDSVEDRLMEDERRAVLAFLESQDNVFVKIETNINQIARITNAQKFINPVALDNFSDALKEISVLKKEQNMIFEKIYSMLAK